MENSKDKSERLKYFEEEIKKQKERLDFHKNLVGGAHKLFGISKE